MQRRLLTWSKTPGRQAGLRESWGTEKPENLSPVCVARTQDWGWVRSASSAKWGPCPPKPQAGTAGLPGLPFCP